MRFLLKLFTVLGLFALLLYVGPKAEQRQVERRTQLFVTDAVGDIVSHWSIETYRKYAEVVPGDNGPVNVFDSARKLGAVAQKPVCVMQEYKAEPVSANKTSVQAAYQCHAKFERGDATITVVIHLTEPKQWRIRFFSINSGYEQHS